MITASSRSFTLASSLCATLCLSAVLSGCQCCFLTERYQDAVDHIADHEHSCEVCYHSTLDLTRIGRPDWCCSRVNNFLCPCRCNQCPPVACPTYVHLGYGWENRAMKKSGPLAPVPQDAVVPDGNNVPEPQLPSPQEYSPPTPAPPPIPVTTTSPSKVTPAAGGKAVSNSQKNNKRQDYVTPVGR